MITKEDFEKIGVVAKHCDSQKLDIAVQEAIDFDMSSLFCENWEFLKEIMLKEDKSEDELLLVVGGGYVGCGGKSKNNFGLNRTLAYYSYSRYVILNGFNDTPNGMVSKSNDFSIPKSMKELELFADRYKNMGYQSFLSVMDFLCSNKEKFTNFKAGKCKNCGCVSGCENKTSSIKSKIITK